MNLAFSSSFSAGMVSEWLALVYLVCKGYKPLARRFKTKVGEVDLIVQRDAALIAVEVKYRPTYRQGVEAITEKQKKRIAMAMLLFSQKRRSMNKRALDMGYEPPLRFDVVIIQPWRWPRHVKNAWIQTMS